MQGFYLFYYSLFFNHFNKEYVYVYSFRKMFVNEVHFLADKEMVFESKKHTLNSKLNHEMIFTLISLFISAV